jgi:hypothetical protein
MCATHPKPVTPLFRSFILQKTLFVPFRFSPPKLVFVLLSPDMAINLFSKPNFLIAWRAIWERISAVTASTFVLEQVNFGSKNFFIKPEEQSINLKLWWCFTVWNEMFLLKVQ